jgi:lipoprotein-anchoring transpeptidase ErfK/SrfK
LQVELPVRPNDTTGWIPASAAHLGWTPYSIRVDLEAKTLTVLDGDRAVLASPVGIGAPRTPTPPASTYVWELVAPGDPSGAYGPDIFGLAEFSDAYAVFNGGDAQIAIHGTDEPWTIGQAASNGCVHLPNAVVTRLVGMLPLGTPVTIS